MRTQTARTRFFHGRIRFDYCCSKLRAAHLQSHSRAENARAREREKPPRSVYVPYGGIAFTFVLPSFAWRLSPPPRVAAGPVLVFFSTRSNLERTQRSPYRMKDSSRVCGVRPRCHPQPSLHPTRLHLLLQLLLHLIHTPAPFPRSSHPVRPRSSHDITWHDISNAARMRIITARFGLKFGSTAVLALGGTPARSFHVPRPTAPAFQGAAAPWATFGRSRARTTRSAADGVGRVGAGQAGVPQWGGAGRGRSLRVADRRCVGFVFCVTLVRDRIGTDVDYLSVGGWLYDRRVFGGKGRQCPYLIFLTFC